MIILTIRTDKPDAEIGLYKDLERRSYEVWTAHRQLSATIHQKLKQLLEAEQCDWKDIEGVIVFAGPGSFTGLRIGAAVGNALSQALTVPIVGAVNPRWIETGIDRLVRGEDDVVVVPEYGAEVHITPQKK